ncbi:MULTISPECIES: putative RNA methyltransferase [Gammaproteobacteria]|uniref:putative RNA methyltransferase n=1 Tax=Gammaproteobacteria TaxID=1236 RepID=UPI000DCFD736|nr:MULTISPECIES: methyltransferase domain-containing protein [Gammaproteobacteria]RTE86626.1 methyltransferase domain-containing protein [Aliidiomarina sp. B3213]TCZ90819.1 methyltransferase domain-containing protein [Lysobacter sp. N42]
MKINGFKAFICPLDGTALSENEAGWSCAQGHHFDRAKEGYINLLPAHFKRSKDPGDSKTMVVARRAFLEAGYYEPLASFLAKLLSAYQDSFSGIENKFSILDAGCGEGFYLREVLEHLRWENDDFEWDAVGIDISKWAVQSAAKKAKDLSWVVASNAQLPLPSDSMSIVLNVFGFAVYEEFFRIMKGDGMLIQVDPGSDHLKELREIIYPEVKKDSDNEREAGTGFKTFERRSIRYKVLLETQADIQNLLTMTPHRYRISQESLIKLEQLESLEVTVHFQVHMMSKGKLPEITVH